MNSSERIDEMSLPPIGEFLGSTTGGSATPGEYQDVKNVFRKFECLRTFVVCIYVTMD